MAVRTLTAVAAMILLTSLMAITYACAPTISSFSEAQAASKPNVVFIMTDDQDAASISAMPSVKRYLAAPGTSFYNSFVTTPQCCPSRATFLTGKYGHNHGIKNNKLPDGGALKFQGSGADRDTIATRMKAAGYATGYVGKYLNEYESGYVPPGWDRWYGYMGAYNSRQEGRPGKYWINENGRRKIYRFSEQHDTDYFSQRATAFMRARKGTPWFLVVAPNAPHSPSYAPKRHRTLYQNTRLPVTPSFNEADVSDKPQYVRQAPSISKRARAGLAEDHRQRLRSLRSVDEMVAQVVSTLRKTGQLSNTYIVYTSDNGWQQGQHRLTGKGTPYEESIRVPLIIRGPGVTAGRTRYEIVANTDWSPTIAGWGGASMPAADGRTLAPLLSGNPVTEWRQRILIEFWHGAAFAAIRDESRTYVEYGNGERELYNLATDPYQLNSMHRSPDQQTLTQDLSARLQSLKSCAGREACAAAEGADPLPEPQPGP